MSKLSIPLRNPYPTQLIVDIHSYCNGQCVICPYPRLRKKNPMGIMDEQLFIKIINDFSELSKDNHFQGHCLFCNMGELFVYPELAAERLRYVISMGLAIDIQTNAALLYPQVVDLLKESGFKGSITISCHGISAPVYKRIMGLDIGKTLKNIDYLLENYPREKIGIQSIPYHWPRGEAKLVRSYFGRKGISVRMPLPNSRAGLVPELTSGAKQALVGCNAGRPLTEMVICFNGDVLLCCNDMGQQEVAGNLQRHSIEEVWNGEAMCKKISQIYGGTPSPDDFLCRKCEFGVISTSPVHRFIKNVRYETRKLFLTHLW